MDPLNTQEIQQEDIDASEGELQPTIVDMEENVVEREDFVTKEDEEEVQVVEQTLVDEEEQDMEMPSNGPTATTSVSTIVEMQESTPAITLSEDVAPSTIQVGSMESLEITPSGRTLGKRKSSVFVNMDESSDEDAPPSALRARRHRLQHTIYAVDPIKHVRMPHKLLTSVNKLEKSVGMGVVILFRMTKMLVNSLLFASILAGYMVYINVSDGEKGSWQAYFVAWPVLTSTENHPNPGWLHAVLDMAMTLLLLSATYTIKSRLKKAAHVVQEKKITTSDYSVLVVHVPDKMCDPKEYKKAFEFFGPVAQVVVLPHSSHPIKMDRGTGKILSGRARGAIVTFSSVNSRYACWVAYNGRILMARWFQSCFHFLCPCRCGPKLGGFRPRIRNAPDPSDIVWKNLVQPRFYALRQIATVLISILALLLTGALIVAVRYLANSGIVYDAMPSLHQYRVVGMSPLDALAPMVVFVMNWIVELILTRLGHWERHATHSAYDSRIIGKLFGTMLVNSALSPLIATILSALNTANSRTTDRELINAVLPDVIQQITLFILFDAIAHLVGSALRPWMRFRLWWGERRGVAQERLDRWALNGRFQLAPHIADILRTFWMLFVYASPAPIVVILVLASIGCQLWANKIRLFRLQRRPPRYEAKSSISSIKWIRIGCYAHIALAAVYWNADNVVLGAAAIVAGCTLLWQLSQGWKSCVKVVSTCACCGALASKRAKSFASVVASKGLSTYSSFAPKKDGYQILVKKAFQEE